MDTQKLLGVTYRPRVVDAVLERALQAAGAVVIEGPRACGKTMTALNACESYALLDDAQVTALAEVAPTSVLEGSRPRLLDEWQLAPQLWNLVRRAVDFAQQPGQFILTGSAVPSDDVTRHTGAGRFLRIRQRTLSWWERGESSGTVSLQGLFDGLMPQPDISGSTLATLTNTLAAPGFPAMLHRRPDQAARLVRAYLEETVRIDLGRLAELRSSPVVIHSLLASIARNVSSEASINSITRDLQTVAPGIRAETVAGYIGLLERVFVLERLTAWAPELRSRARLRTSSRWHLADPSLVIAALGADAGALQSDPNTAGLVFESAAVHDLAVLSSALDGSVHHYRDSNGYEIDAVVTLPDGLWGAVAIKLGGTQAVSGAKSLAQAVAQIDSEPVFRLVLTGTGGTAVFDDGTVTCPLGALGP